MANAQIPFTKYQLLTHLRSATSGFILQKVGLKVEHLNPKHVLKPPLLLVPMDRSKQIKMVDMFSLLLLSLDMQLNQLVFWIELPSVDRILSKTFSWTNLKSTSQPDKQLPFFLILYLFIFFKEPIRQYQAIQRDCEYASSNCFHLKRLKVGNLRHVWTLKSWNAIFNLL